MIYIIFILIKLFSDPLYLISLGTPALEQTIPIECVECDPSH